MLEPAVCGFTGLPAYFRQGVALQYLGRHADALAAFASGLAQDPKSLQLLVGMVEAAMKSPLRVFVKLKAPRSVSKLKALRSVSKLKAPRSVSKLKAPRSVSKLKAPRSVSKLKALRSVSKLKASRSVSKLKAPRSVSKLKALRSVSKLKAPRSVSKLKAPRSASRSVSKLKALRSVSKLKASRSVSKLKALHSVSKLKALRSDPGVRTREARWAGLPNLGIYHPAESLEPTYQQLQKMKLDRSPFVVVSVIGQELLSAGHHGASVVVLEAGLKIGTCSLKLRGSVFSALSSAYWLLGNTEKSSAYMQQDLEVAKTLGGTDGAVGSTATSQQGGPGFESPSAGASLCGVCMFSPCLRDQTGECRAHGNLGSAFFSKGNYREALTNHRHQLVLAMKLKDREANSQSHAWSFPACLEFWGGGGVGSPPPPPSDPHVHTTTALLIAAALKTVSLGRNARCLWQAMTSRSRRLGSREVDSGLTPVHPFAYPSIPRGGADPRSLINLSSAPPAGRVRGLLLIKLSWPPSLVVVVLMAQGWSPSLVVVVLGAQGWSPSLVGWSPSLVVAVLAVLESRAFIRMPVRPAGLRDQAAAGPCYRWTPSILESAVRLVYDRESTLPLTVRLFRERECRCSRRRDRPVGESELLSSSDDLRASGLEWQLACTFPPGEEHLARELWPPSSQRLRVEFRTPERSVLQQLGILGGEIARRREVYRWNMELEASSGRIGGYRPGLPLISVTGPHGPHGPPRTPTAHRGAHPPARSTTAHCQGPVSMEDMAACKLATPTWMKYEVSLLGRCCLFKCQQQETASLRPAPRCERGLAQSHEVEGGAIFTFSHPAATLFLSAPLKSNQSVFYAPRFTKDLRKHSLWRPPAQTEPAAESVRKATEAGTRSRHGGEEESREGEAGFIGLSGFAGVLLRHKLMKPQLNGYFSLGGWGLFGEIKNLFGLAGYTRSWIHSGGEQPSSLTALFVNVTVLIALGPLPYRPPFRQEDVKLMGFFSNPTFSSLTFDPRQRSSCLWDSRAELLAELLVWKTAADLPDPELSECERQANKQGGEGREESLPTDSPGRGLLLICSAVLGAVSSDARRWLHCSFLGVTALLLRTLSGLRLPAVVAVWDPGFAVRLAWAGFSGALRLGWVLWGPCVWAGCSRALRLGWVIPLPLQSAGVKPVTPLTRPRWPGGLRERGRPARRKANSLSTQRSCEHTEELPQIAYHKAAAVSEADDNWRLVQGCYETLNWAQSPAGFVPACNWAGGGRRADLHVKAKPPFSTELNEVDTKFSQRPPYAASSALSSLGHVYTAIGDYPNALASHKQCVILAKQSKDQLSEARELGNMGAVYIAMGDFANAVQCHEEHLGIAKALVNKREEARAYSNLGSAYHYRRDFDKAMSYHTRVLELAQELEERPIEMRAYAGLGHAARCMQDLERAKQYHQQQLAIAEGLADRAAEGRASSNLGEPIGGNRRYRRVSRVASPSAQGQEVPGQRWRPCRAGSELGGPPPSGPSGPSELVNSGSLGESQRREAGSGRLLQEMERTWEPSFFPRQRRRFRLSAPRSSPAACWPEAGDIAGQGGRRLAVHNLSFKLHTLHAFTQAEWIDQQGALRQCLFWSTSALSLDVGSRAAAADLLGCLHSDEPPLRTAPVFPQTLSRLFHTLALNHYAPTTLVVQRIALAPHSKKDPPVFESHLGLSVWSLHVHPVPANLRQCSPVVDAAAVEIGSLEDFFPLNGGFRARQPYLFEGKPEPLFKFSSDPHTEPFGRVLAVSSHQPLLSTRPAPGLSAARVETQFKEPRPRLSLLMPLENLTRERSRRLSALEETPCPNLRRRLWSRGAVLSAGIQEGPALRSSAMAGVLGPGGAGRAARGPAALRNSPQNSAGYFGIPAAVSVPNSRLQTRRDGEPQLTLADDVSPSDFHANMTSATGSHKSSAGSAVSGSKAPAKLLMFQLGTGPLADESESQTVRQVAHHRGSRACSWGGGDGAGFNIAYQNGIIHQMKGDYETALKLHKTHLSIAQELSDYAAQGRAYGNMGNAYNALGVFDQAVRYHRQELQISMEVNDRASQASTHGNLAVAYQALGAHDRALQHYQNHLNIARELRDVQSEARALGNLGNFHCSRGEFPQAVPYYEQYLRLSPDLQDMESEGKVCHNLGYAHYCLGSYQEAVKYYEQDLALAKDLHDKLSQAKAYCNLGLAFKALGNFGKAEECQKYLLSLAQSLNNQQARFRALGNLGDIFVCKKDVAGAIKFYEQQLALAHQVKERKMEACAYAALGTAYRMVHKFDKALGYHTQELEVYQELGDIQGECQAHGHLAAVYMSLGKYTMAFKCYEEQLELGQRLKDPSVEAQVYGNMGITKMNMNVMEDAIGYLEQQLATLQQLSGNEAVLDRGRAYGNLGDCYEALGDYEEAIKYYDQYLSVAQSLNRMQDQEKAYRGLGNGHRFSALLRKSSMPGTNVGTGRCGCQLRAMGSLQQSLVCFEKRLVVAHELGESSTKAQAYGELGSLHSQLGNYEQAISCLERQLGIARETGDRALEAHASCGLGSVYQLMGEHETALRYHQLDLDIAEATGSAGGQARAYGNLGLTHESLGNYERAVVFQEQHLSIAAETNDLAAKTLAYGSLGRTHHALQNYTQAVMYLQEASPPARTGNARQEVTLAGAGKRRRDQDERQRERRLQSSGTQLLRAGRRTGGLGGNHAALQPVPPLPDSHAAVSEQARVVIGPISALVYSLWTAAGIVSSERGPYPALAALKESLRLAEQLARREDEAKIRHRLGLSLWASSNLEEAQHQQAWRLGAMEGCGGVWGLYRASALFETIRHEAQHSTDYKLSLFDLQTSSYQALQRVLVSLGHHDEALAVAERGRTRAFADLLVERQTGQQDSDPYTPVTVDHILDTVNGQRALVLYFSLAAGYLYSWLLAPGAALKETQSLRGEGALSRRVASEGLLLLSVLRARSPHAKAGCSASLCFSSAETLRERLRNVLAMLPGILKFHEVYLGEGMSESGSSEFQEAGGVAGGGSSLEQHITCAREALGVDSYYSSVSLPIPGHAHPPTSANRWAPQGTGILSLIASQPMASLLGLFTQVLTARPHPALAAQSGADVKVRTAALVSGQRDATLAGPRLRDSHSLHGPAPTDAIECALNCALPGGLNGLLMGRNLQNTPADSTAVQDWRTRCHSDVGQYLSFTLLLFRFSPRSRSSVCVGCSSSETESEAGDLLDQQFEELNNKLNSVTDPTGFLRMVSRNNLFNSPSMPPLHSCQNIRLPPLSTHAPRLKNSSENIPLSPHTCHITPVLSSCLPEYGSGEALTAVLRECTRDPEKLSRSCGGGLSSDRISARRRQPGDGSRPGRGRQDGMQMSQERRCEIARSTRRGDRRSSSPESSFFSAERSRTRARRAASGSLFAARPFVGLATSGPQREPEKQGSGAGEKRKHGARERGDLLPQALSRSGLRRQRCEP
ncbi:hypothetical protein COCON_G00165800 [Conger conger]|uniref:Tetratricopeptide repeat protein 28 n=1 Tax=Conger conger TaxID=82655 RepID=A0A9Q1D6Q8_CONCO|nr:hypothetical protein COCON_G00165800 [Conger conger]